MSKGNKRPPIPESVKRELWAKAAGRCEFKGCNICLYQDSTTKRKRNSSEIAHIISWTPDGPRGDAVESPKLAKDISNLMLTCPVHNNLIDDPQYVDQYPVELLRSYKKEHEDRVFRLTGLGEDYSVTVIELISKIQNQTPQISEEHELQAILPYYPAESHINIDLTAVESIDDAKKQIDKKVEMFISQEPKKKYAAFIMAKIPYACYLGYSIGNKVQVTPYQFFRNDQSWIWKEHKGESYSTSIPENDEKSDNVCLKIEISGIIDNSLIPNYPIYSITASSPGFMFLNSYEQVVDFRMKLREMLDFIRNTHGEDVTIHLIPATPNPISFEIGRTIMKNIDPSIVLYDKVNSELNYKEVTILHNRIRNTD